MIRTVLIITTIVIYVTFLSAFCQSGFIPISLDYASFRGNERTVYVEVFLSFFQNYLTYVKQNNHYLAEYIASVEIIKNDSTITSVIDRRQSHIDSLKDISTSRKFLNTFRFQLQPNKYNARVIVKDIFSNRLGEYIFDLETTIFVKDSLALSDVQLATKISADTVNSDFLKNSYQVIPNPGSIYGISLPVLYYYAEVYNLQYSKNNPGSYILKCNITDVNGNVVKTYRDRVIKKPGNSAVIVGGHNIVTLPAAVYFFNLKIFDEQSQKTVGSSKRFAFLKPVDKKLASKDSISYQDAKAPNISIYASFSEKDLDLEFKRVKYISGKQEQNVFKQLDVEGKREFLENFWKKHDPNDRTEINEYKKEYFKLLNYANINFNAMKREGWETDRGRILLTYGVPSEIDRHYMSIDREPYEIWQYNSLEGGVIFVFADLTGFGDFELLHSTLSRELFQTDWERLILKARSGFNTDTQ
jgi:GWxTD domain-containing protein